MNYRDEDALELVLELIYHIGRRTADMSRAQFLADRDEIDLTAYRLSIIGETCGRLDDTIRQRHANIDWRSMVAMRNVIAHD